VTRNKPITLANGDILLPLYDEREWACLFAYSSDGEKSWGFSAPIRSQPGNIQPAAVQLPDGSLLALMRTGGKGGYIWRSHSFDAGRTWTPPRPTELPNPNSGIDLIRLPAPDQAQVANGHLALAFNNTPRGRPPLNVALSLDEGQTWPHIRAPETGPGEFSYPALLQTQDGLIHVTYTYRRETIAHTLFDEEWLQEGR